MTQRQTTHDKQRREPSRDASRNEPSHDTRAGDRNEKQPAPRDDDASARNAFQATPRGNRSKH